ncbi:protein NONRESPONDING TO OXYLIPINS 2, mitochondrial-like isoform X1 [Cornus florida]|uniref:protein NONRESPONDING TO OXYLIPINS 2, mitochondrial-like isoform X1 n=1 Tax=Cornus florida TaxID=4283 RepID=UPI0028974120|nr:protein NONRESPONDING TO OXYLIPINS 2, mitochondrial-like isoform X1 [Cornus florida]
MASKCNRIINRTSVSSLRSTIKSNLQTASASSPSPSLRRSTTSPVRRFFLSRVPMELGGAQSLLPLHSAVATARMTSGLSSRSCRAISQELGLSVPR